MLKIRFNYKAFIIFLLIFVIEVVIALYVNDRIIRPYAGDVLVVMLMYYFIKSFIQTKHTFIVIGVLAFAYLVELGQYMGLVEILGLANNKVACVVIGSSFSWVDMGAYSLGASICYLIDKKTAKEQTR